MSKYYIYADTRARLLAYIAPVTPHTIDEWTAFGNAVNAQIASEAQNGPYFVSGPVKSISDDGMTVTFTEAARGPEYTQETVCPAAWAYLRNAGLIRRDLPTANTR